jgi:ketosteroid isomerase-like protein
MKRSFIILFAIVCANNSTLAQKAHSKTAQEEIIALEKSFSELVISQDTNQIKKLQSDTYFLAVGVQGKPLNIIRRNSWLKNLKNYVVESYSIDDIKVNVYGNTAVALMLYSQKATSHGRDRSAQFVLTDIWVKKGKSWVIAERHSSRPEVPITNN